jgi:hypothetical protein
MVCPQLALSHREIFSSQRGHQYKRKRRKHATSVEAEAKQLCASVSTGRQGELSSIVVIRRL